MFHSYYSEIHKNKYIKPFKPPAVPFTITITLCFYVKVFMTKTIPTLRSRNPQKNTFGFTNKDFIIITHTIFNVSFLKRI